MMDSPLLFDRVSKTFPRGRDSITALNQLSFTILQGKVTGLLGPDGSGKTTLIRLAAQLLLPDEGAIHLLGNSPTADVSHVFKQLGYMPQRFGLYEDLSVQENLTLYSHLQGLSKEESLSRQHELLKLTNLGPYGERRAGALSGGMKQKLGLACALLRIPQLLLLDEPTVGVDPMARRELWHIIQSLKNHGVTTLMSTAYFDEAEHCDQILLLHEGRLLIQDSPQQLMAALTGRTYLVSQISDHHPIRQLQEILRHRENVQDVRRVTEGIRVLIHKNRTVQQEKGETWLSVSPRFDDVFIDLLGSDGSVTQHPPSSFNTSYIPSPHQSVITVHELSKSFGQFEAVKNVSFTVNKGEIFGLLGANGAGKTTTFRMLCGLLPASSGLLHIDGIDMRHASSLARARLGYVSQKFSLYGNLSCNQNLHFFAAAYGLRGQTKKDRIQWALTEFDLHQYQYVNTDQLPLGIKQRLALSCALLHEPTILFLDEPTSGVDPLARREFWQRINLLASTGVTVLVTTHYMDEAEYCDRLVLMSLGEILAQGTPKEIRQLAKTSNLPEPTMEEAFISLITSHETDFLSHHE